MKLSSRLMLVMIVLVIAAATAIALLAYDALVRSVYPGQLTRMEADARLMVDRLDGTLREAKGDAAVNAAAPAVVELLRAMRDKELEAEAAWKGRLANLFKAMLAAKPEYFQLRLIGAGGDGREVVRVDRQITGSDIRVVPDSELQPKGEREYFSESIALPPGAIYVSPIELNREFGEVDKPSVPVVRVAAPVHDQDGRVQGIVVINIDLRPAFARLRNSVTDGSEAYVVNQAGDYLVHPQREREFAFEFGEARKLQDDFPELANILRLSDKPIQMSRSVTGASGAEYAAGAAAQKLGDEAAVAVVLLAPRGLVLAPADTILRSAAVAGLAAIVVAALLAFLLSRTIVRPLAQLTRAVERFDRGEPVRLPRHAPKEIDILASAFRRHIERERLFSAAVHGSTDAVITISLDGKITAWNPAAEEMFGYTAEEAVGRPMKMLVPGDRMEEYREKIRASFIRGEPRGPIETERLAKDGSRVEVSLSISPVRSLGGEVTGASAIYRDITSQKRAAEMFRLAVDASPAAMLMTDAEGRVLMANEEAENVFGFPAEELLRMKVEDLMASPIREKHQKLRGEFMRDPSKRMMGTGRDLRGRRRDGTEFPLEIALNPINGPQGPMVLSVVVDITERKKSERALQIAKQTAEQTSAMKSQFLANMSHELRTPLNAIIGYSDIILMEIAGPLEPQQYRDYVRDIREGGNHLLSLINDLLDLSKAESGKLELLEENFDLVELAVQAVDLLRGQAKRKGIELAATSETKESSIYADARMFKQILLNLIGNAIKFTPKGGNICVKVNRTYDGEPRIVVSDSGMGIPKDQIPRAFAAFVQIENAYTRTENTGTGLGLALCKRYVEMHDGKISLESPAEGGTTVTVILPRARALASEKTGGVVSLASCTPQQPNEKKGT